MILVPLRTRSSQPISRQCHANFGRAAPAFLVLSSLRGAGTRGSRVGPRRSSYAQAPAGRGDRAPAAPAAVPADVWHTPTPARGPVPAARSDAAPVPAGAQRVPRRAVRPAGPPPRPLRAGQGRRRGGVGGEP